MCIRDSACAVLMCSRGTPMFLAGDEFGNTQFGNNNSYCQDNEISWLDWNLLQKNRELFEFFKYMIAFRHEHRVIREKLDRAVCGMDSLHSHDVDAEKTILPKDTRTISVSFAGYDRSKGRDDIVYVSVNTHWENVEITLPRLKGHGCWYLCVNTYGDEQGQYCYPEGKQRRIDNSFIMRPRSVAVFTVRKI